jgi:hypothetical protein
VTRSTKTLQIAGVQPERIVQFLEPDKMVNIIDCSDSVLFQAFNAEWMLSFMRCGELLPGVAVSTA